MAVVRLDSHLRRANMMEIDWDIEHFGEQVVSDAGNMDPNDPYFFKDGTFKDLHYSGPERLSKSVFTTRIVSSERPEEISDYISEVNNALEVDETVINQGYQVFFSDGGKIYACMTSVTENPGFNQSDLEFYGKVSIKGDEMYWYPSDSGGKVDFTSAMVVF